MPTWQTLDLASAVQMGALDAGGGDPRLDGPFGEYSAGTIHSRTGWSSPDFYFPGIPLNPATTYQVEITFDPTPTYFDPDNPAANPAQRYIFLSLLRLGREVEDYEAGNFRGDNNGGPLFENLSSADEVQTATFGPGNGAWDAPDLGVSAGFTVLFFETELSVGVSRIRISPPVGGPTHAPPLRLYPRSDGLGASSAPRLYPLPRSIQASNRRAGGYL